MKNILIPALAVSLLSLSLPSPADARDNDGGGPSASCDLCAERIVWGHVTVYCESGYNMGFTSCHTVDVPGPQSEVNSCVFGNICSKGKSWPFFSVY